MKNKKFGFTLAEVLITLAIIGVVAALTLPTLMTNYQKHVVETKLVKFYAMINQAVQVSNAQNGYLSDIILTDNFGKDYTYERNLDFLKKYILPYIIYSDVQPRGDNPKAALVNLQDGSSFSFNATNNGVDIAYYINYKDSANLKIPRNIFPFQFSKANTNDKDTLKINSKEFVEPYTYMWDGTVEGLKSQDAPYDFGCYIGTTRGNYCTKLIQLNNWKIPNDYPW